MRFLGLAAAAALTLGASAQAQDFSRFSDGPVITGFGKVAKVDSDLPIPKGTVFKVMFNVSAAGKPGEVNRGLDSAARFLNMHVAAGVPARNIHIVVIVSGPASGDVAGDSYYSGHHQGTANANAALVQQLVTHGVRIYLCGQSGTAFGVSKADMLPGVKLSLSAMTAVALYQKQGYVLLP